MPVCSRIPPRQETFPKFNTHGTVVAFIENYKGGRDLYTVTTNSGISFRVTHHPSSKRLNDWINTADLLFIIDDGDTMPGTLNSQP